MLYSASHQTHCSEFGGTLNFTVVTSRHCSHLEGLPSPTASASCYGSPKENFHFQLRAQGLSAPAPLCSLSQQTFLSPKDEREAARSAYRFRANELRWYSGIPCIMKVLNKAGKYHFCLSVALPSPHSLQHVSPSR